MAAQQDMERTRHWNDILRFFHDAEIRHPQLASQLPAVVLNLVQTNKTDHQSKSLIIGLRETEAQVHLELALLGEWLRNTGFEGFVINLSIQDRATIDMGRALGKVLQFPPNRETFYKVSGIAPEHQQGLNQELVNFSRVIGWGLAMGFSPKAMVAGLLYESVTGGNPNFTSKALRTIVNQNIQANEIQPLLAVLGNWMRS